MSTTLLAWATILVVLLLLSLRRPMWAVCIYLLTFFACPTYWWWGTPIASYRWSLYGGVALLLAVIVAPRLPTSSQSSTLLSRRMKYVAIAMAVNATLVHFAIAQNLSISSERYILLLKLVVLFLLFLAAIRTPGDLRIILFSVVIGAAYIGYEATFNDRGSMRGGRLEGIGAPGHGTANDLAALMVAVMPLAGGIFMTGRLFERLLALVAAPLILNTVLLCNSRGAFLAAIASGVAFLVAAPKAARTKALALVALGAVAVLFLLRDPDITNRFITIFTSSEERDNSASNRLDYWRAGLLMISDYPLGAGGDGFKRVHGPHYIQQVSGADFRTRSVHQGYIDEACEWGLQGLALRLSLFGLGILALSKGNKIAIHRQDSSSVLMGTSLMAGLVALLTASLFGTVLSSESSYWILAFSLVHYQMQHSLASNTLRRRASPAPLPPRRRRILTPHTPLPANQ